MLSRFVRTTLASLTLAVPAALAACSAQSPDDATSQSDQAIVKCAPGYKVDCESIEGSRTRTVCSCVAMTFYDVVIPSAGPDTCGTVPVPVPPALAPYGCTPGILVDDNQPVWACPVGTPVPARLGVVSSPKPQPLPTCQWNPGASLPYGSAPCEAVIAFTQSSSNCLGNAPAGWKFILDTEFVFSFGGGCNGQCAHPVPPNTTVVGGTHG